MKVHANHLTGIAYTILCGHIDGIEVNPDLASTSPELYADAIERCEFALALMKAVRDGKKRLTIDILKPAAT